MSTPINQIQGAGHISPLKDQTVTTTGIVTAVVTSGGGRGFYLQNPTPDSDPATSEGIFVFLGSSSIANPAVGQSVQVTGRVNEFRPSNNANNLTTTQISASVSGGSVTVIPSLGSLSPTVIGSGGRVPPTSLIDSAAGSVNIETNNSFNPNTDGIDFYESLEGMLVQLSNPVSVSPTSVFSAGKPTEARELWVLADNGAGATGRSFRGGINISPGDFNPERIQIDDTLIRPTNRLPIVNVGTQFASMNGVVSYNFNNYEVLVTGAPSIITPSSITKEVTTLGPSSGGLRIADFNVENLDPSDVNDPEFGGNRIAAVASAITQNLLSPDILSLAEVQDNNGETNNGIVSAVDTLNALVNAIKASGGPAYEFRQIDPENNQDGGQPGGNIRVAFLYNPDRVKFVDRPGGGAKVNTTVSTVDGLPQLSSNPGRILDTDLSDGDAFDKSRKPLVGEFMVDGERLFVIGCHFNSKGGDQPLFGPNQQPTLTSEIQRIQQAQVVGNFVSGLLGADPKANVVVLGDLNDFEFSAPVNTLKSSGLFSLTSQLPQDDRFSFNYQGNGQVLDHILVSKNLFDRLAGYDIVHINSEFTDGVSDHDPSLASFELVKPLTPKQVKPSQPSIPAEIVKLLRNPDAPSTPDAVVVGEPGNLPEKSGNTDAGVKPDGIGMDSAVNTSAIVNPVTNQGDCDCEAIIKQQRPNSVTGTIYGTDIEDVLVAAAMANTVYGFRGNDTLFGGMGNNNLFGGGGFDTIYGGMGRNFIRGGRGADQLFGNGGEDVILGGRGRDTVVGGAGSDFLAGGRGDDVVYGNPGNDFLAGGKGNDLLMGGPGNDNLCGCAGDDILRGGAGDDNLNGEAGNDLLIGGRGVNTLTGGAGSDRFRLQPTGEAIITDFTPGQDTIELSKGLQFSDLKIVQGIGATVIGLNPSTLFPTDKPLAVLVGVEVTNLTTNSFVKI